MDKKKTRKKTTKKSTKKKSKKLDIKPILMICLLLILAIILVSITFSYAFWTVSETPQTKQNEIAAGCLKFDFNDIDVNGNSTSINLQNAYPISDEKGLSLTPYTFTVTNTCTLDEQFYLYFHNLGTSTIDSNYIKLHFSDDFDNPIVNNQLVNNISYGEITNDINSLISEQLGEVKETYLLNSFILKPEESKSFKLRLWIDYSAPNEIMGLKYISAVSAFATTPE